MNGKSRVLALLLTLIPGLGHLYLRKERRGVIYLSGFILPILIPLFLIIFFMFGDGVFILSAFSGLIFMIATLDMLITIIKMSPSARAVGHVEASLIPEEKKREFEMNITYSEISDERFKTILLAFIPGLGHLNLNLMQRGLSFLIGFFGIAMMVIFLTSATRLDGFAVFLGFLPVIWIYNLFDIVQKLNKKQSGEHLVDRSLLEDIEQFRETEKKSKTIASLLSFIPGVGHLYLGLQKRGFQLLLAFFLAIYILDILRLSLFMFLIPIIWFYSFFDALQLVSKQNEEERKDIPVFQYFTNHQRWIGIGLLVMGIYYMIDSVIVPAMTPYLVDLFSFNLSDWYYRYFQTTIVCILLIGGGLRLLSGSKVKEEEEVS
jgi:hypothetical protein